jgi:class 3 adenylate cyclase
VASFNATHAETPIALKIALHQGSCIAVTTAGILDYFGTTVNTAARLQSLSKGGEVVISAAILADAAARALIAGLPGNEETAALRGLDEPVAFTRLSPPAP